METCEYFDFDTMRGILLQTRECESALMSRKPKMKVSEREPVITAERIEEHLDFMKCCCENRNGDTMDDFYERLTSGSGMNFVDD